MKNFVQNLMILFFVINLCSCSITHFPDLLKTNNKPEEKNVQTTQIKFNSFIEQKISIYKQQYQRINAEYLDIKQNNNIQDNETTQNIEQRLSVLIDAISYTLKDERVTSKEKTQLQSLKQICDKLSKEISQQQTPSTISPYIKPSSKQAEKNLATLQEEIPLFGTKSILEGENLLISGKKPALVIKSDTEYKSALNTIVKATTNMPTQNSIDIIYLSNTANMSQASQRAQQIYEEIILMGMNKDNVSINSKTDKTITESVILIYTH